MTRTVRRPGLRSAPPDATTYALIDRANAAAEALVRGGDADTALERIVGHFRRQWRGDMQQRLKAHVAAGRGGLSELALRAVVRL